MELNRFKQLLESTIGNVKPLIMEQITMEKGFDQYTGNTGFLYSSKSNSPLINKVRIGTTMIDNTFNDNTVPVGVLRFYYSIPETETTIFFTIKGTTSTQGSGSYGGQKQNVEKEVYSNQSENFTLTPQKKGLFKNKSVGGNYIGQFDFVIPTDIKSENIIFYKIFPSNNNSTSLTIMVNNK
jgi:hypothetical protein